MCNRYSKLNSYIQSNSNSFRNLIIAFLLSAVGFGQSPFLHSYFEMDVGFHTPQAEYDKYVDPGISFRTVYSYADPDFPFIHYDIGFQYLQFRYDQWWEDDCCSWLDVRVTNKEQSYALLVGPRLTIPAKMGAFRPYVGIKGGLFLFTETTTWEWDDDGGFWCWVFGDCDDYEDDSATELLDAKIHPGWVLNLGTNVFLDHRFGIDLGVQYNVIPGLGRPQTIIDEQAETIGFISNRIDADYVSIYLGISVPFASMFHDD